MIRILNVNQTRRNSSHFSHDLSYILLLITDL
jgi:hypothetical protein